LVWLIRSSKFYTGKCSRWEFFKLGGRGFVITAHNKAPLRFSLNFLSIYSIEWESMNIMILDQRFLVTVWAIPIQWSNYVNDECISRESPLMAL